MSTEPEASLKMVAPGAGFVAAPFIGQNIGEDQKKKKDFTAKRVGFQSESSLCDDQKKKRSLPTNQWVFGLKRKKQKQMVSPQNGDTRGGASLPP